MCHTDHLNKSGTHTGDGQKCTIIHSQIIVVIAIVNVCIDSTTMMLPLQNLSIVNILGQVLIREMSSFQGILIKRVLF